MNHKAPDVATATAARPNWIQEHQLAATLFAFLLILLYVSPIAMIAIAAWTTTMFQEGTFWLSWFAAFMKTSESTLSAFHKVLLPIISGLSVVVFQGKPTRAVFFLGLFVLVCFVMTTFIGVLFDMSSTQIALKGLPDPINLALVGPFFTRVQETLLMYLMLLLGIGVANATSKKQGA